MPNDSQRIEWIIALVCKGCAEEWRLTFPLLQVKLGYRDQIVVSHDVYSKHRLTMYGGHGYRHLHLNLSK